MRGLSLFSGIGGFDLGFERAGIEVVGMVEKHAPAMQVLNQHYPNVFKLEDVRNVRGDEFGTVDIVYGGSPCQDVSIAGGRAGLAGKRSGLFYEMLRIVKRIKPEWFVLENVPGLLSARKGRDFAAVQFLLAECGYRIAWRVLDAQYFGVPQRRRRVFVIGHRTSGRAAQVLFEPESFSGYCPSEFSTRQAAARSIAGTLAASGAGTSRPAGQGNELDFLIQTQFGGFKTQNIADTLNATDYKRYPVVKAGRTGIRRLTPVECERLQGFPDNWTHGLSDAQRYRALGNAVAVPVAKWLGKRIMEAN